MTVEELSERFRNRFGADPDVIASAPGRLNLIGEHTDYNGGEVLPIAIDRRTFVAMRSVDRLPHSTVISASEPSAGAFDARDPRREGSWWDYMAGVCSILRSDGIDLPQFEAFVMSDVPAGAGLSSSAALEISTAVALAAITGRSIEPKQLALVGWRAETQFVGVNSGVMDQFASALCGESTALHLWCDTLEMENVPMKEHVLIFDTATPRSLRGSQYNARRQECDEALRLLRKKYPDLPALAAASVEQIESMDMPPVLMRRTRHVSEETRRVGGVVNTLKTTGRIAGHLLYESHESLRSQYECSTPQLDWFVDRMHRSDGISGARLTGAGWGGCAIAVGAREALAAAKDTVLADYTSEFGLKPRAWLTSAGQGARLEATPVPARIVNG